MFSTSKWPYNPISSVFIGFLGSNWAKHAFLAKNQYLFKIGAKKFYNPENFRNSAKNFWTALPPCSTEFQALMPTSVSIVQNEKHLCWVVTCPFKPLMKYQGKFWMQFLWKGFCLPPHKLSVHEGKNKLSPKSVIVPEMFCAHDLIISSFVLDETK